MNSKLEALFDEPEKAYLRPEELSALSQFVSSLPERINFYRRLRNEEVTLMQAVADALQQQFPNESEDKLKRSLQNIILTMRYVAMAMLIDDDTLVSKRLSSWLPDMVQAYETEAVDLALHQLIREQLSGRFSGAQMALLISGLDTAKALVSPAAEAAAEAEVTSESLVGLF